MANVLERTTKEYRRSVNTPDFSPVTWLVLGKGKQPEIAFIESFILSGKPTRYLIINPDGSLTEMNAAEKEAVDRTVQTLAMVSNAPLDFEGIPTVRANGVAMHTITISKKDLAGNPVPVGTESVFVRSTAPVARSASTVVLAAGVGTFTVGPSSLPVDLELFAVDPLGVLKPSPALKIQFS